jgi:hypothetical protein
VPSVYCCSGELIQAYSPSFNGQTLSDEHAARAIDVTGFVPECSYHVVPFIAHENVGHVTVTQFQ